MTKKHPLVTVMIPVYNRADFVGDAIRSVLNQTYTGFELIVHDDASTDQTWEIIKEFHDPRIRAIHTVRNHGMLPGWNYIFRFAKGEFVKQMGSDDLLEPDCLASEVRALQDHPQAALVTCRRRVINDTGKRVKYYELSDHDTIENGRDHAHWILTNLRENKIGEPAAVLFRQRLINQAGKFDTQFSQFADFEYWIRLLEFGDLIYLNQALVSFREHPGSNTAAAIRDGRFISEIYALVNKYYGSAHFRDVFRLTDADRRHVLRMKFLDTLKNIKDLFFTGQFSQAFRYLHRLRKFITISSIL